MCNKSFDAHFDIVSARGSFLGDSCAESPATNDAFTNRVLLIVEAGGFLGNQFGIGASAQLKSC
jgi:hypothetical protein